jgi:hypothetical protein
MDNIRVEAPGLITGRNGTFDIVGLSIWYGPATGQIHIDGVGKRGTAINGGLAVKLEGFEQACKQFLEQRGWLVLKGGE